MVEYGTSSYGLETGSAAGELGLDSLKAGQLLIVHMMIPLRFASQAGAGQAVVHYMDIYFVFCCGFFIKGGIFCPGMHTHKGRGKFSAGWCAACCHCPT
jgi:hypothetical protein